MLKINRKLNKINKMAIYCLSFAALVIILVFGLHITWAAWQEPSLPPPQGNTSLLIDVGPDNQAKSGSLRIDPSYDTDSLATDITHTLEVRGDGAKISTINVNGNLTVDTDTLFVNSNTQRVGIGTTNPASKLTIEGNTGLLVGAAAISGRAIEAITSGASSHGVYGSSTATDKAGVYGVNDSANSYGVWGESGSCAGVYGTSADGIGLKAETAFGPYALYAKNNTAAGNYWAGYFSGRLEATDEVIGSKFLPTKLQNSLVPYTGGWIAGEYSLTFTPYNLAFDGTYIWVANGNSNKVAKLRVSDGSQIGEYTVSNTPRGMAFDGTYLWVATASNNVSKLLASDGSKVGDYNVGATPIAVIFDGTYIWTTNNASNNLSRLLASDPTSRNDYATGINFPQNIIFDGTYIWVSYTSGSSISKFDTNGSKIGDYAITGNPRPMVFDGEYLWAGDNTTNNLYKINPISGVIIGTYTASGRPSQGIVFDGTYIWTGNNDDQITQFRAYDGSKVKDYYHGEQGIQRGGIIFDGTYLWISSSANKKIYKIYSGTGYGHTDLSSVVNLQTSTTGTAQTGSFSVSGTGTIDTNLEVGGDLIVNGNTWGGTGDEVVDVPNPGTVSCDKNNLLRQYFIKGVEVNDQGNLIKILCRPL